MRKIFLVLVAILLIASTAQAVEWTQAMTAEYAAQPKGRSVVTDSAVIMNVWYTGTSSSAGVGVSGDTVLLLYSNVPAGTATTVDTIATYTTVGAAVDFINNQAGWHASVGNDAYRAMLSRFMLAENIAAPGDREDNAFTVNLESSSTFMSCGVLASVGKVGRIKEFNTHLESLNNDVTIDIYDGDTSVYHKNIVAANYQSSTALGSSQSTVTFSGKGLSGTKNTPLCLVIDSAGTLDTTLPARTQDNVSIIYDKLGE